MVMFHSYVGLPEGAICKHYRHMLHRCFFPLFIDVYSLNKCFIYWKYVRNHGESTSISNPFLQTIVKLESVFGLFLDVLFLLCGLIFTDLSMVFYMILADDVLHISSS